MKPKISIVTLGVKSVPKARAFYESLGLPGFTLAHQALGPKTGANWDFGLKTPADVPPIIIPAVLNPSKRG